MKIAPDTNVLVYAEGVNDPQRRDAAVDLLERLPEENVVIPVQVLGELFNVLVRKGGRTPQEGRAAIRRWHSLFPIIGSSPAALLAAADLAATHQLRIWDSVVLSAAAEGGCRLLLSEDMQEGFTWGGVTVTNPFAGNPHPVLSAFLAGSR